MRMKAQTVGIPCPRASSGRRYKSRPWVLFLAISAFIYAGLSTIGGLILVIEGAQCRMFPVVAWGLFSILYGFVAAIGGFLLIAHAGHLGRLRFACTPKILELAWRDFYAFGSFRALL